MPITRFSMPCAVHVFLRRDDEVLLLRRANTGYEDGKYSVIAGHLDGNEEVLAAAVRETREEAGIELTSEHVRVVGVMHRKAGDERIDFFVEAWQWSGEVTNAEAHKCAGLDWYPLDELPADVIPYVRRALENYRDGTWFDSYGWQREDGTGDEKPRGMPRGCD
jgi:8-oxo-dGTP diphosphatase